MWSYLSQDANTLGCAKSIYLTGINECLVFFSNLYFDVKSTHALSKIYIWDHGLASSSSSSKRRVGASSYLNNWHPGIRSRDGSFCDCKRKEISHLGQKSLLHLCCKLDQKHTISFSFFFFLFFFLGGGSKKIWLQQSHIISKCCLKGKVLKSFGRGPAVVAILTATQIM